MREGENELEMQLGEKARGLIPTHASVRTHAHSHACAHMHTHMQAHTVVPGGKQLLP